jgi:hypothetical protein
MLSFATILGSGTVPLELRAGILLLSFVLAWLVFRFVELPIRRRVPARASAQLATGLGILGIAGLLVFSASGVRSRFGHDVRALQVPSKINHNCVDVFPTNQDFNYCKATSDDPPEVIFLGDSRTQAVYDAMVSLSKRRYPMMLLARGGCPALLDLSGRESAHRGISCNQTWRHFVAVVHRLQPQVVVLVGGGSGRIPAESSGTVDVEFKEQLSELIHQLQATTRVIYMREPPAFDTGPDCFLRPVRVSWGVCAPVLPRAAIDARMAAYNHTVDAVQAQFPELKIVDSVQALCDARFCAQRLASGEILYRDSMHLSNAGARRLDTKSGLPGAIDAKLRSSR